MSKVCKNKCEGVLQNAVSEHGTPFLMCDICGHCVDDWLKWDSTYSRFWEDEKKWLEYKNLPSCLLGYFADLFQKHYGCQFAFSLSPSGLFKGPEMIQIRKILKAFVGDGATAKAYIDWVFLKKVSARKRKITSLGFLSAPAAINEFLIDRSRSLKITRSTPMPAKILKWMGANTPSLLSNYSFQDCGDLRSFLSYFSSGAMVEDAAAKIFVDKLRSTGIINSDMKIKNWSE